MNYHIVVGVLGSGQGDLSRDLVEVLAAKNGSNDSVVLIPWGRYNKRTITGVEGKTLDEIMDRIFQIRESNQEVIDVVAFGPKVLENINNLDTLDGSITLYLVDRIDHIECRQKAENYWKNELDSKQVSWEMFTTWIDQQEAAWNTVANTLDREWSTIKTFIWDQDSEKVEILPADSQLSYLKRISIQNIK